jgi:hypothetical protein
MATTAQRLQAILTQDDEFYHEPEGCSRVVMYAVHGADKVTRQYMVGRVIFDTIEGAMLEFRTIAGWSPSMLDDAVTDYIEAHDIVV